MEIELEDDDPEELEPLEELDPELPEKPEFDPVAGEQVDPTSTYPEMQAVHWPVRTL